MTTKNNLLLVEFSLFSLCFRKYMFLMERMDSALRTAESTMTTKNNLLLVEFSLFALCFRKDVFLMETMDSALRTAESTMTISRIIYYSLNSHFLLRVVEKMCVEGRVIQRAECRPLGDASYMRLKRCVPSSSTHYDSALN